MSRFYYVVDFVTLPHVSYAFPVRYGYPRCRYRFTPARTVHTGFVTHVPLRIATVFVHFVPERYLHVVRSFGTLHVRVTITIPHDFPRLLHPRLTVPVVRSRDLLRYLTLPHHCYAPLTFLRSLPCSPSFSTTFTDLSHVYVTVRAFTVPTCCYCCYLLVVAYPRVVTFGCGCCSFTTLHYLR